MATDTILNDEDPLETQEWVEAILSVLETQGADRAQYLLQRLSSKITETVASCPTPSIPPIATPFLLLMKRACLATCLWSGVYAHSFVGTLWRW